MKHWEMVVVSAAYLAGAAAAYVGLALVWRPDATLALILAATAGTLAGAWLYSRRVHAVAGLRVKAAVGALLAGLCLAVGLTCQMAWRWMADPHTTIAICVAGTFVFPIVLFGTMELIFIRRGDRHYRFK